MTNLGEKPEVEETDFPLEPKSAPDFGQLMLLAAPP